MIENPDHIAALGSLEHTVPQAPAKPRATVQHHYYSAKSAEIVATIIADWHRVDYRPIALSCHDLGINSNTLYQQINHGLNWLVDYSDNTATREYFTKIRDTTKATRRPETNTVELSRCNTRPTFRVLTDNTFADTIANLTAWVDSNPPLRAKWPAKSRHWNLTPEQVKWFKDYLAELKSKGKGFEALIKSDEVIFVHIPTLVLTNPSTP